MRQLCYHVVMKIVCIVGSLREKSFNRAVFNTLVEAVPSGVSLSEAPIRDLPLYNADTEDKDMPESVKIFKNSIEEADGVIIITPEYNRSVPGVLKNAIDWASRPDGGNSWAKKPVTLMGATDGSLGTAPAQMHLKGVFTYLGSKQMGQPEFYLGRVKQVLSEDGTIIAEASVRERVQKFLQAFITHIQK